MDMSCALFQGLLEAIEKIKLLVIPYFKKQIYWEIGSDDDISQRHTLLERTYCIFRRMETL